MTFSTLALSLCIFWAFMHWLPHVIHRLKPQSFLPTPLTRRSSSVIRRGAATVTVHKFHLRVESTALNARHDALASWLAEPRATRTRHILAGLYDAGSVVGVLGMLGGIIFLAWTLWQMGYSLFAVSPVPQPVPPTHIKRGLDAAYVPPEINFANAIHFQFLIPGITLPLSHLPLLLLALFVSQVIHEAGHAICAAIDDTPLQSVGACLILVLPAAFVSLHSSTLRSLAPRSRARIAAAGAFHNLILWIIFWLIAKLGLGQATLHLSLYGDVSNFGRVVTSIDSNSPLVYHLPVGALVTKLDDFELSGHGDTWTAYLGAPPSPMLGNGWCAEKTWFLDADYACCAAGVPPSAMHACFTEKGGTERCINPVPLLVAPDSAVARCDNACEASQVCVRPRGDETLLRISVIDDGVERVVLWRGPRMEVWEQVQVDVWRPRWAVLPVWLPSAVRMFFEYVQTLTLSLFVLNLLPLPRLDGSGLLDAALEHLSGEKDVHVIDSEDLEGGPRSRRGRTSSGASTQSRKQWNDKVSVGVRVATLSLIVGCIVLGMSKWLTGR